MWGMGPLHLILVASEGPRHLILAGHLQVAQGRPLLLQFLVQPRRSMPRISPRMTASKHPTEDGGGRESYGRNVPHAMCLGQHARAQLPANIFLQVLDGLLVPGLLGHHLTCLLAALQHATS